MEESEKRSVTHLNSLTNEVSFLFVKRHEKASSLIKYDKKGANDWYDSFHFPLFE